jgi:hypothetical protein
MPVVSVLRRTSVAPCGMFLFNVRLIRSPAPCKGFSRANRNGGKNDMQNNKVSMSRFLALFSCVMRFIIFSLSLPLLANFVVHKSN